MAPDPKTQIRWGLGTCLVALLVIAVLAFVPDPLFRYRAVATTLDNVEGLEPGTKVYFRGAAVGEVDAIELNPGTRAFDVELSVLKQWHPSPCSYVTVASSNPFTTPRVDLVSVEADRARCATALAVARCDPVSVQRSEARAVIGCRRSPDLFQSAVVAVQEAANVARTANQIAQRLQGMLQGSGGDSAIDMAAVAQNATQTLAALNSLSTQLDRSFSPGQGDIALTLANVRQMTGRASTIDVASLNGILKETNMLVAQNQRSIAGLLEEGHGTTAQARLMLENASASLVQASANLERMTESLSLLSERMAADPTFAVRGQAYRDPPSPGGK